MSTYTKRRDYRSDRHEITIWLGDAIHEKMLQLAKDRQMTPKEFCKEAVESVIAHYQGEARQRREDAAYCERTNDVTEWE